MKPRTTALPLVAAALLFFAVGCSSSSTSSADRTADDGAATEPSEQQDGDAEADGVADEDDAGADAEEPTDDAAEVGTDGEAADGATQPSSDPIQAAVAAVEDLTALLSSEQQATMTFDYGDSAIVSSWSNLPACDNGGRAGIQHGDLTDEQLDAVYGVIDSVLSTEGAAEYRQIIAADEELGGGNGEVWDADCYYLAIFGSPSSTDPWALQFGGHHYARTFDFSDGVVSVTPAFTGVEPIGFTVDGDEVEPLADEATAIFAMFAALDDGQLAAAELSGNIDEVLLGPGADDAFPETEGLALAEVSEDVQALALAAIRTWVDDNNTTIADQVMAEIEAELDETSIGWSNAVDADALGSYGRIDGPSVWIEFVNEGGVGTNGIHHHSIHRDKTGDYGSAG